MRHNRLFEHPDAKTYPNIYKAANEQNFCYGRSSPITINDVMGWRGCTELLDYTIRRMKENWKVDAGTS